MQVGHAKVLAARKQANKLDTWLTTDQVSERQDKPRGLQSVSEDLHKMETFYS